MSNARYIQAQFNEIELSEYWNSKLVIRGFNGGQTNWLSITNEQFEQIKQILLQGASDETVL